MEGSKTSSTTMQVSFVCQRCSQPLKLDTSFNVLDRVTIQELIAPIVSVTPSKQSDNSGVETAPEETFVENKQDGVSRKYIPPARMMSTESANSFTLIGDASDGGTMENLSRRLKVTSDLFDIMSGQTDVDHPLCEECTDTLLDHLDTQLNITENECSYSAIFCLPLCFQELPLYCSGGLRFFWDNKFDHAMVAFLDCVQQFKEEVEKGDTGFCLPYRMDVEKGKIEDTGGSGGSYSIKTQFNSEEQWTKALKFMLTNLKWGLAWVTSQFYNR
uniref:Beclin-1 n=1 Tax=Astatotilapia calliptera TaxID=8154 RepID=A0AAX7V323_ASTCA